MTSPSSSTIAQLLGLGDLTVCSVPNSDIPATLRDLADEYRRQLDPSAQDTIFYCYDNRPQVSEDHRLVPFDRPTALHEIANFKLFLLLHEKSVFMGVAHVSRLAGASLHETGNSISGIRPDPSRYSDRYFPAGVIISGDSKPLSRLCQHRDWLFENSSPGGPRGEVKVVVTVKVYPKARSIVIQLWHRGQDETPTQSIAISPMDPEQPSLGLKGRRSYWSVDGGPLIISLEDLFGRDSVQRKGNPICKDNYIVINEEELVDLAIFTWTTVLHDRLQPHDPPASSQPSFPRVYPIVLENSSS